MSASNYEMAREVDMNLAEVDMETFRTSDLEQPAFRLTYSSPVNDDLIRISNHHADMECLLTDSLGYGLDRYVNSLSSPSPTNAEKKGIVMMRALAQKFHCST
jgi:hypothetical protein